MKEYDFVVIGGGSAGYAAAKTAGALGITTALIDGGDEIGGLCILRGCMPSKALIESANRYRILQNHAEFGLGVTAATFDLQAVMDRKTRLVDEFADYRSQQLSGGSFDFIRGKAVFIAPYALQIDLLAGGEQRLQFKTACIATGSIIHRPSIPGIEICAISDDLLERREIPSSIIILGGGPVALEMAYYLESFGTKVTILQRNIQLLTGSDRDVADALAKVFRQRGMEVLCGTKLLRIEKSEEKFSVFFEHENKEQKVTADLVLNALGRRPNLTSLDLNKAGLLLEGDTLAISSEQRTKAKHLFAAGDCCDSYGVVHLAIAQGEVAAKNAEVLLRGGKMQALNYSSLKLLVAFTEPQVAMCGMTEQEALSMGHNVITASYPFADHGKSILMGEIEGFVKLIASVDDGRILGAAVIGPHGSELIHEVVVAMALNATVRQFVLIPHYHPTLSEIWTYPAEEIVSKLKL